MKPLREVLQENLDRDEAAGNSISDDWVHTGLRLVDACIGGFRPGQLIVVAGAPGAGKSAFVHALALPYAHRSKRHLLLFSPEMRAADIADRLLAAQALVDLVRRRSLRMSERDWSRIASSIAELPVNELVIDDDPILDCWEVVARVRSVMELRISAIIIDGLQSLGGLAGDDPDVGPALRELRLLAHEARLPVFVTSRLTPVALAPGTRPRADDLPGHGALAYGADVVILLHRPELNESEAQRGYAEVIIEKHRTGPTTILEVGFVAEFTRFVDRLDDADAV